MASANAERENVEIVRREIVRWYAIRDVDLWLAPLPKKIEWHAAVDLHGAGC
jgi:hypothetical protein